MREKSTAETPFAELCKTGLSFGAECAAAAFTGGSRRSNLPSKSSTVQCLLLPRFSPICAGERRARRTKLVVRCFLYIIFIPFSFIFVLLINVFSFIFRPRLKNVDRSTAQQLAVTVGNVTVIITDFKEKTRSSSTSSSTVTSSAGSEQQNQSSSGSESTDKGSSRSSTPKGDMSAVNDESF